MMRNVLRGTTGLLGALAMAGAGLGTGAADAESIVEPAHSFDFVVDNGVCDFPVEWSGRTRSVGIDTVHGFISLSPNWTVRITNTETGTSWSPAETFYPDGTDTGWVGRGQIIDICEQLS